MHDEFPSIARGALRSHLFERYRCAMAAPATTLVIDAIRDVGIAECGAERRHWTGVDDAADVGALQSVQNDMNVQRRVGVVDRRVALERGKRSSQTLARGLMAGGARGGEQGLALGRIVTSSTGRCRGRRRTRGTCATDTRARFVRAAREGGLFQSQKIRY